MPDFSWIWGNSQTLAVAGAKYRCSPTSRTVCMFVWQLGDASHVKDDDECLKSLIAEETSRESFTAVVITGISMTHVNYLRTQVRQWTRQLAYVTLLCLNVLLLLVNCIECVRCRLLWSMILAVRHCVTQLHCANTTEQFDVLLRVETLDDPRNIVLDRSHSFLMDITSATCCCEETVLFFPLCWRE